ncbi:PAS domain-containing protein [Streptomyces bacillaris]|uniref:PAS domain-containing protein n=2 Tax=Streptomyces bacillaris TaxID=68179 RepID=UPI00363530D8
MSPMPGGGRSAAAVDALPDGLVFVDGNGTVVGANARALALFEAGGDTGIVGRGLLDLLPDFDWRDVPGPVGRMRGRRTDGGVFAADVVAVRLEDGGEHGLMLVVRDLTGVLDAETALADARRQTEAVLRAVGEGVVGTDAEGRIVLVNPAAAQLMGYRASALGGRELHALVLHTGGDGEPVPFEESPLADTLRTGRRHRVQGQVLWARDGDRLVVDVTIAPVCAGERVVGAVVTFVDRGPDRRLAHRHAAEVAAQAERHGAELRRLEQRYEELAGRHRLLAGAVAGARRGHLEELRTELVAVAADDACHLWPEAGRLLGRLATGYTRMAALLDDVLDQQLIASGEERLRREAVDVGRVVDDAVRRAVELLGHERTRFAVRCSGGEAEVDPGRLAVGLAHLVADVAGGGGGEGSGGVLGAEGDALVTVVVTGAGGQGVRIEVRGPYGGGDPLHQSVVSGIVGAHGGVVQRYEAPGGGGGGVYVVELPGRAGGGGGLRFRFWLWLSGGGALRGGSAVVVGQAPTAGPACVARSWRRWWRWRSWGWGWSWGRSWGCGWGWSRCRGGCWPWSRCRSRCRSRSRCRPWSRSQCRSWCWPRLRGVSLR